jgi:hypothetical protein
VLALILDAERVTYGEPFVLLFMVKPTAPVWALRLAPVVVRPLGVVQAPLAAVQYWNLMEPTLPVVATNQASLCAQLAGLHVRAIPAWRQELIQLCLGHRKI